MSRKVFAIAIIVVCTFTCVAAQEKSELERRAETEAAAGKNVSARSLWLRAYEADVAKGQTAQGVDCGIKAAALYHGEKQYQEAFDLLRQMDQAIVTDRKLSAAAVASCRYKVVRERLAMYLRMHRSGPAAEQLEIMERHANASGDDSIRNDFLYNKAIFHYAFGQDAKGNAIFREMAQRLTAQKEYDKVETVYKTLIANSRKSGNANMVAQAYEGYVAWKDSASAMDAADERAALQAQIAAGEATISEKDATLSSRQRLIGVLSTIATALGIGAVVLLLLLLRAFVVTRSQKRSLRLANEAIALKAHFISNIAQLVGPTLEKLDARQAEVKALRDFTEHIQTLTALETTNAETVTTEETQLQPFCQKLTEQMRERMRPGVSVKTDVPNMSAKLNREYVGHILSHLLDNAAAYTPDGGNIHLDCKKRGPHKLQFIVSNTGPVIEKERQENVFIPFAEVKDLSTGDGLGLPICRQMAVLMKGELSVNPEFTKGTQFVLNLHL